MSERYDAVLVGAGHNGLVCAAYLARAGLSILVLERREVVGGAAVTEELISGFRFDSCAHRLGQLDRRVVRDLGLGRHGLQVRRPELAVLAPVLGGERLAIWRDPERTTEEIRRHSPNDAARWSRFGAEMAPAVRFLRHVAEATPPELPPAASRDLLAYLELGLRLRLLGRREMAEIMRVLPMSAAELLDEWFASEPLRGVLAAMGVNGLFMGPRSAGTAYLLLSGLSPAAEVVRPTALVTGGMGRLTEALASAARASGARIRTGVEVERILTEKGKVSAVALSDGEEIAAARVVSNVDPKRTFLGLVEPTELDPEFVRRVRNVRTRGAFAKVHLALAELPRFDGTAGHPELLEGLIRISPSLDYLERAYDDAKYGGLSRSPYLEAVIPSVTDPTLAPTGQHAMSVYVQYAPHELKEGSWDAGRREVLGDRVVETLSTYAPGFADAILDRHVTTPADLEEVYGLTGGCASHGEMALDQLFFMRPVPECAQYRTPIRDLYLCGAGTHPGGGVGGTAGYNAAREVLRAGKRAR
ncbi:MAG: NAD(P)/FAD-dependent oxidoreductase [Gemmatimonadales bacterium]